MRFSFNCENPEDFKELQNITYKCAQHHFETFEFEIKENKVELFVDDSLFIKDLQVSKEDVYKQNRLNNWFSIKEKEPPSFQDILIREDTNEIRILRYDGNVFSDKKSNETFTFSKKDSLYWKSIESDEVLLKDFLSDLEENLSFVSKILF